MLRKFTEQHKKVTVVAIIVLCVLVGVLIFYRISSDFASKLEENGTESNRGEGLQESDEAEDTVETVPWYDSEDTDVDANESDVENSTASKLPEQGEKVDAEQNDTEQDAKKDTEPKGDLEENILDDGKEWGQNIS